jgi:hypothetical protein
LQSGPFFARRRCVDGAMQEIRSLQGETNES